MVELSSENNTTLGSAFMKYWLFHTHDKVALCRDMLALSNCPEPCMRVHGGEESARE